MYDEPPRSERENGRDVVEMDHDCNFPQTWLSRGLCHLQTCLRVTRIACLTCPRRMSTKADLLAASYYIFSRL